MLPMKPEGARSRGSRRGHRNGQAHLHSAHGIRERARVCVRFSRHRTGRQPTPPSDHRTRELGARHTSGDECYPAKVTVGDFMKVLEQPGVDPSRVALLHADSAGAVPLRAVRAVPPAGARQPMAIATSRSCRPAARTLTTGSANWRSRSCAPDGARCSAPTCSRSCCSHAALTSSGGETRNRSTRSASPISAAHWKTPPSSPRAQLKALRSRWSAATTEFGKLAVERKRPSHDRHRGRDLLPPEHFLNENLVQCLEGYGAEAWVST